MKNLLSRFAACCVSLCLFAPAVSGAEEAALREATGVRATLFSSIDGTPLARIRIDSITPARTRVGPLRLSSPGYKTTGLTLKIHAVPCSDADWDEVLARIRGLPADATGVIALQAPDGHRYRLASAPSVQGSVIFAALHRAGRQDRAWLRVARDAAGRPALRKIGAPAPAPASATAPATEPAQSAAPADASVLSSSTPTS